MEKLFGLIGHPVQHSISPKMHNHAFDKLKVDGHYMAFDLMKDQLEVGLNSLKVLGFSGFNVTIPYKQAIMKYLDWIDPKAEAIGAVNTVVCVNKQWMGYNTDVDGFLMSLKRQNVKLEDKKVCVLGHGGAAKAVVYGLLENHIGSLDIFSRNPNHVDVWFKNILNLHDHVDIKNYEDYLSENNYDLIINTTPVGMAPNIDQSIIDGSLAGHENTVFYDLIYKPSETLFLKQAKSSGRKIINGLDMLIYQGILALEIWLPDHDIKNKWTRDDVIKILV